MQKKTAAKQNENIIAEIKNSLKSKPNNQQKYNIVIGYDETAKINEITIEVVEQKE